LASLPLARSLRRVPRSSLTPEEFGAVAAFLSSALASYVTGTIVRCDGGYLASL
jgi:enoyl-[acyl-carrier-protein] reductase (NADH)